MTALLTDLYQLTMAAGYFASGKTGERAVFELFVRRLPKGREYLIAAGLQQAVEYLTEVRFRPDEITYLCGLPQFSNVQQDFWDFLLEFRFTGDLFAMPEGTPFLAGEPIATVHAPIVEGQIVETYLLSTLAFQSMIAAKASHVVTAARGRAVVEFGSRRAHGPEAGLLGARAAFIGGCAGTSNVAAGQRFAIPVFGTSAHSWVLAFNDETEAFAALQRLLGTGTVYLIDSFDTVAGARRAAALGPPMWGVRLDSGDLNVLAHEVRRVLDDTGFPDARIMATSDLNEQRITALLDAGAPIDVFGVGTELATSYDAPALGAVYKLVELESRGVKRLVAKYSPDKQTLPGAKQVFRYADRDVVGSAGECPPGGPEALLRPVILAGKLAEPLPSAGAAREHCKHALQRLPSPRAVEYSSELLGIAAEHNRRFETH
ncbi:MAG TPA: nicotinate phosphoribosyltransferase [Bryobacteraceae bacterium]|nr:nicotinate phosphoribosyltransferase [Bryobacteraceae bacterium]